MKHTVTRHNFAPSSSTQSQSHQLKYPIPLRVVCWNIERGMEFDRIVAHLRDQNADILLLQELDVGCERSGFRDVPAELASALSLNAAFVPEFEELHSPLRSHENRIGDSSSTALHGNAIMTRFDIADVAVIEHNDGLDWDAAGDVLREPRHGKRVSLGAKIRCAPGEPKHEYLYAYTMHTEVFAGAATRLRSYADVLEHVVSLFDAREDCDDMPVLIGGDLNTQAHGIVRLSPTYARDRSRFTLPPWLGEDALFDYMACCPTKSLLDRLLVCRLACGVTDRMLELFRMTSAASSPLRLRDPFDVGSDITFDHPGYRFLGRSFVTGKYDWLLSSKLLAVVRCARFNQDLRAADHFGLVVDYEVRGAAAAAAAFDASAERVRMARRLLVPIHYYVYFALVAFLVAWAASGVVSGFT